MLNLSSMSHSSWHVLLISSDMSSSLKNIFIHAIHTMNEKAFLPCDLDWRISWFLSDCVSLYVSLSQSFQTLPFFRDNEITGGHDESSYCVRIVDSGGSCGVLELHKRSHFPAGGAVHPSTHPDTQEPARWPLRDCHNGTKHHRHWHHFSKFSLIHICLIHFCCIAL